MFRSGTQVAVKRVLPHRGKGRKLDTMHSGLETANSSDISGNAGMMSMGMKSGAAGISSWGGMGSLVGGFKSGIGRSGVAGRQKQSDWKKLKSEFLEEMRYLSKLRHPCITTTMGKFTLYSLANARQPPNNHSPRFLLVFSFQVPSWERIQ